MPIKYFALGDIRFTPFGNPDEADEFKDYAAWTEHLNTNGIVETKNEREADLYVTQKFPILSKKDLYLWRLKHRQIPVLIWTHEPRYCNITTSLFPKRFYKPDFHVMDVFTGDVFLNHYTWFGSCIDRELGFVDTNHFHSRERNICTLGSYRPHFEYYVNGKNIDLCEFRQEIALEAYKRNMIDISGRWWPEGIKTMQEDRLASNWHESKMNFIKNYKFNLCLENTNYGYYLTEKIWDAITALCLPIYYGTETVYQIFEKNSFVDTSEFDTIPKLLDYIESMTVEEYTRRLNSCIKTYNHAFETVDFKQEEFKAIDRAIERIKTMVKK